MWQVDKVQPWVVGKLGWMSKQSGAACAQTQLRMPRDQGNGCISQGERTLRGPSPSSASAAAFKKRIRLRFCGQAGQGRARFGQGSMYQPQRWSARWACDASAAGMFAWNRVFEPMHTRQACKASQPDLQRRQLAVLEHISAAAGHAAQLGRATRRCLQHVAAIGWGHSSGT